MKNFEKETIQAQLTDEQKALQDLQKAYKQAKKDCQEKIRLLNARKDMQNLQSIVHQKKYQQALMKQIDGVLNDLQNHTYKTANEFFQGSYQNGYIGSMYELQKQGIPITVPVSTKKMIRAIQTDSKLSQGYYLKQGLSVQNIRTLKKQIALEATRGIASGKSWLEVAESLSIQRYFQISESDAMRICRTEGNRINQQARLDAGDEAVKSGCDLLKQWDATLDGVTRPWHREADGQIVEWDEKFIVNGEKMDAPSIGGSASNVINCRCQLLKRPRWAFGEEELERLKKRAEFFGLDKSQSFEDYKQKFLQIPDKQKIIPADIIKPSVSNNETEIRQRISETKKEYSSVNTKLKKAEDEVKLLKDSVKFYDSNFKDYDDPRSAIESKLTHYKNIPSLWEDEIKQLEYIRDHLDEFKTGSVDTLKKTLQKEARELRKELKAVQTILDSDYDELETIVGKVDVGQALEANYGEDHCKQIKQGLLDAPAEYRDLWNASSDDFRILGPYDRFGRRRQASEAYYSPSENGVWLSIKSASKDSDYQTAYQVVYHEYGHHTDHILNVKYGDGDIRRTLSGTYKEGIFKQTLTEEANDAIEKFAIDKGFFHIRDEESVARSAERMIRRGFLSPSDKDKWIREKVAEKVVDRTEAEKAFCKFIKETVSLKDRSDISDMFEPVMQTTDYPFGVGHGKRFWSMGQDRQCTEAFAEIYSAKIKNEGSYKQIEKYFPKSIKIFEEMIEVIKQ